MIIIVAQNEIKGYLLVQNLIAHLLGPFDPLISLLFAEILAFKALATLEDFRAFKFNDYACTYAAKMKSETIVDNL